MVLDQWVLDSSDVAHRMGPKLIEKKAAKRRKRADGVGFEPTVRVNVRQFSRLVQSTELCHPSVSGRESTKRSRFQKARPG